MKKRLDFVVIYFWLFLLLCAGLGTLIFSDREERVSESEKRLRPTPTPPPRAVSPASAPRALKAS